MMNLNDAPSVAVVGAGIAGLTAAHRLKKAGIQPVVFEASDRAGGRMYSEQRGDFLFDLGTIALMGGTPILQELIDATGLGEHFSRVETLIGGIVREGVAKRLDFGHPLRDVAATDLFSLGSKLSLAKLGWDIARHGRKFDCESAVGLGALDTQSVQEYAEARLGKELADYLCGPLIRGIWMASARKHSAVQLLWTARQLVYPMYSLRTGNGSLPIALAQQHQVRYQHEVTSVDDDPEGGVQVRFRSQNVESSERFAACVIAMPPPLAIKVRRLEDGEPRRFFEAIRFSSILAAHFALSQRPANPEAMLMFPEPECPDAAVVFVNHNKALGRAPAGKGSLSLYFGVDWSTENFKRSDDELLELARARLQPHYGPFDGKVEQAFIHRWPMFAMDAPPGLYRLMDDYDRALKRDPPALVQFAGDFMPNPGINQALSSGAAAAQRILRVLGKY